MENPPPNPALLADLAYVLHVEELAARTDNAAGRPRGPVTGIKQLDKELGGFMSPGIHTLLAAPGAGKTALALQIAGNCGSTEHPVPALYVTCEMRPTELLRRIMAQVTGNVLTNFSGGKLAEAELQAQTTKAVETYSRLAIYDSTLDAATPSAIINAAQALKDSFESRHILIVVDSLTDWAAMAAAEMTEYQANELALNSLKKIALALVCPVVVIVHRHRAGNRGDDENSKMFAGKATGRIEYISESMWNIEGTGDKKPDVNGHTKKKLTIVKNRKGTQDVEIPLLFEGRCQRFTQGF